MRKRALLIVNRHARQGQDNASLAAESLTQAGLEVIEQTVKHSKGLSAAIRRYRDQVDLVIIGGGDGTLNSALDGLLETKLPLGILPLGTANDLARTLGIPNSLPEACRIIAAGETRQIDLGWVNGQHFLNVSSIGLSTRITQELTQERKRRWGVLAYLVTALQVLRRSRPFKAEIICNDRLHEVKTVQIAVGNGRYYGGGMTVAEDAAIDDQQLDLYSLEIERWWQVIFLLPAIRRGALAKSLHVRTLRSREFHVRCRRRQVINTDGELTCHTPAHFRLIPRALTVFAPAAVPLAGPPAADTPNLPATPLGTCPPQ